MTLTRFTACTLAVVGLALCGESARAQDKDNTLPKLIYNEAATRALTDAKTSRGIAKADLPAIREYMATLARHQAERVAHPLVYKAGQDALVTKDSTGAPIPTIDQIIADVERALLVPNPAEKVATGSPVTKVTPDNADYIREVGSALDAAFKPLIETHPERIVRVNAMRVYAAFCKTGASAHWPTVTALLANANTPTEVKYYAIAAAGNLLSAPDLFDYKTRRHAISKEPRAEADREIGAVIAALENCILDPNAVVPLPGGKVENATNDQLAVIGFVRRQAVKSLGQVRYVTLPGPKGSPIYPAHTLARVAMSDPAIVPAPTAAECGEAVIGLCNMAPIVVNTNGQPLKGFNPDALAEAVTVGLINFASPRANPLDRSVPWRGYSMRIAEAFKNWRPLFDPLYDPLKPGVFDQTQVPKVVNDLITRAQATLLAPMDKVDASGKPDLASRVDIEGMKTFLKQLQGDPKRSGVLITGVPATALPAIK